MMMQNIFILILLSFFYSSQSIDCTSCGKKSKIAPKYRSYPQQRHRNALMNSRLYANRPRYAASIPINELISKYCPNGSIICHLEDKGITSLHAAIFPESITILHLSQNSIQSLENVKFPSHLIELHLDANKLSIDMASHLNLSYLISLKSLYLGSNQIKSIQNIQFPVDLEFLSLSGNQISSFTDIGNLQYLQSLTGLNLNENNLRILRGDLRNVLPQSLIFFGLAGNGLAYLEVNVPIALKQMDLKNNPLQRVHIENEEECAELVVDIDTINDDKNKATHLMIDRLPKLIWNSIKEKKCDICCENFAKGDVIKTLPCLHQFHCQCVDGWFMRHQTCPDCRHDANVVDFEHDIPIKVTEEIL